MLGQIEGDEELVVADLEAGLGTLSRLEPGRLDVLVVVAEPTAKSVEIARRALEMIREKGLGHAMVVANRADAGDRLWIERELGVAAAHAVPDSNAIRDADRTGAAPFDVAPEDPGVAAIRAVAETLRGRADLRGRDRPRP